MVAPALVLALGRMTNPRIDSSVGQPDFPNGITDRNQSVQAKAGMESDPPLPSRRAMAKLLNLSVGLFSSSIKWRTYPTGFFSGLNESSVPSTWHNMCLLLLLSLFVVIAVVVAPREQEREQQPPP